MNRFVAHLISFGLLLQTSTAAGPDYLTNNFGPVTRASKLPTPFTPLPEQQTRTATPKSRNKPAIQDIRTARPLQHSANQRDLTPSRSRHKQDSSAKRSHKP